MAPDPLCVLWGAPCRRHSVWMRALMTEYILISKHLRFSWIDDVIPTNGNATEYVVGLMLGNDRSFGPFEREALSQLLRARVDCAPTTAPIAVVCDDAHHFVPPASRALYRRLARQLIATATPWVRQLAALVMRDGQRRRRNAVLRMAEMLHVFWNTLHRLRRRRR